MRSQVLVNGRGVVKISPPSGNDYVKAASRISRAAAVRSSVGDRLWVADMTYVPTWAGFLYRAVVLDAWSRRVIGWAMESHLRTELVLVALNMAVEQRRPQQVIHHSDQGC